MTKVSIILVHFGKDKILEDCINSIHSSKPRVSYEIVVVDNNVENRGYSKGNNLGVSRAKGEYVFILNPDTLVKKGTVDGLLKYLEKNKKVGAVAPSLYDEKGKVYPSQGTGPLTPIQGIVALSFLNKIFPNNSISKKYWMKDVDRSKPYEADVIPGTAFMIRKDLFNRLGGFDKNFFLYFEESDFFKRVKEAGYKLFILPKASLTHFWGVSTPPGDKIRKIFRESRFYYFKKNFGILSALLVEFFARLSLTGVMLFLILALGIFLRFYRIEPNIIFNGEMGRDYLDVWGMLHGTHSWLIGPRTSHEWFFLPPIAYWIYAILLSLAKFSPTVINYFFAVVGSFAVFVCYYYVKKLFNERIAIISSLLLAVSPAWIDITRSSRYNMPAAIIFFPYIWILQKSIKDKGKSLFALGLILGLSMSFFPSPLLLIPAAIVCFIFYRVRPKLIYILYSVLGLLIPNLTFIIYEASHRFSITLQLLAWIPYRVLGFLGLYHKNTVNSTVLSQNFYSIYQFFADSFVPVSGFISVVIFAFVIAGSALLFKKFLSEKKKEISFILIFITLGVSYLGLFLHGDPPGHYYYVIFPIPLILLAYLLDRNFKNKFVLIFLTGLLGLLGIWNLIKLDWFNQDASLANYPAGLYPYTVQLSVASEILQDAKGSGISIGRIGSNDQFENNFANNYIYLLTIRGIKVSSDVELRYTIVEERNMGKIAPGKEIWEEDGIQIFRSVK